MNYCPNCGRLLNDGEVCNCTANPYPQQFAGQPMNGQPVYNNVNVVQPPKKKSSIWLIILAIALPLLLIAIIVLGILAAILVPVMIGYTSKSKLQSMNTTAKTIYLSGNTSLTEFDEQGYYCIYGTHIVSSDSSKDAYTNDLDNFTEDQLRKSMNEYFDETNNYEWFIVIRDGVVIYSAAAESWKSTPVGTYPGFANIDRGPSYCDGSYSGDTKTNLKELYDMAHDRYFYWE